MPRDTKDEHNIFTTPYYSGLLPEKAPVTPLSFDACFRRFRSGVPDCSPQGDGGGLFPENAPVTPVTRDALFRKLRSGKSLTGGGSSSPISIDSSMYSTSGRISALLSGSATLSPASSDPKCFSSQASWPMATARFQICSSKDFLGSRRLRGVRAGLRAAAAGLRVVQVRLRNFE